MISTIPKPRSVPPQDPLLEQQVELGVLDRDVDTLHRLDVLGGAHAPES